MSASIYKDLIEEKIAVWRTDLKKLEEIIAKADSEIKGEFGTKIEQLKPEIDKAIVRLYELDAHETVENTMETKTKIRNIFDSIDRMFPRYEEQAPYML